MPTSMSSRLRSRPSTIARASRGTSQGRQYHHWHPSKLQARPSLKGSRTLYSRATRGWQATGRGYEAHRVSYFTLRSLAEIHADGWTFVHHVSVKLSTHPQRYPPLCSKSNSQHRNVRGSPAPRELCVLSDAGGARSGRKIVCPCKF